MLMDIAELLNTAKNYIDADCGDKAVRLFSNAVAEHPEMADARFATELRLIEALIADKALLKESEYTRSFEMVSKYCKQVYGHIDELNYGDLADGYLPDHDKIWWCWLQGLDNAPDIVRACFESLKKLHREIIVLDSSNIHEYINIPKYIMEAYNNGRFSSTHFSDLIRLELLTSRGGMWIDATVYCSDSDILSDILQTADLFVYRAIRADNISRYATYDSWFIYAAKHSHILEDTKRMLYAYWSKENNLKHYFLLHILMNIACERHREEEARIPIYSTEPCHILQMEMFNHYNEHRFGQIMKMSGIHKLTYKYDKEADIRGTYLDAVMSKITW